MAQRMDTTATSADVTNVKRRRRSIGGNGKTRPPITDANTGQLIARNWPNTIGSIARKTLRR